MITRRRRFVFAMAAMLLSVTVTCVAVLAADLYAHRRAENSAGLNRWGYRGPVVPAKAAGEMRMVMVGGSTVFGYGGPWHEAAPAFLERELRKARPATVINVINLGYNNDGAFAAVPTLEDYRYLDYDLVILYQGYNDRTGDTTPNRQVYRRQSVVFRWTGYSPILPLVLHEKAMVLRHGPSGVPPSAGATTVFRPNVAARTSATAMETAGAIGEFVGRQLDRLTGEPTALPSPGSACAAPWSWYCESMLRATTFARGQNAKVLIVGQPVLAHPTIAKIELEQQASLAAAVQAKFGADSGVRFLDLSRAIDLTDPQMSFDRMHLGPHGNLRLAQLMAPAVTELAWPAQ